MDLRSWLVGVAVAGAVCSVATAQTKGFDRFNLSKAAIGEAQIELYQSYSINPDCTPIPGTTMTILSAPKHGKATVAEEGVFPAFPSTNARSACNTQKVAGHVASYQAVAGYSGRDEVVLQTSSPSGTVREIHIDITVR